MHSSILTLGVAALIPFASAVPLDSRDVRYGDREQYASAWNAGNPPPAPTFAPPPGSDAEDKPPNGGGSRGGNEDDDDDDDDDELFEEKFNDNSRGIPPPPTEANDDPFALSNGYPNIKNPSPELSEINLAARGSLSNAPPPAIPASEATLSSLRLVAFNEHFEAWYFTELIRNVTEEVDGYRFADPALKKKVLDHLIAVQAQEQLHALNANNALKGQLGDGAVIKPCQYNAPVDNFEDAVFTAMTFTDIVMGTLADISVVAGGNGDAARIRGFAASLGQEGEQNGFYRDLLGKIPSALPFLTASLRDFAFNALLQNFVIEGSCPNLPTDFKLFGALKLLTPTPIQPQDQDLEFEFTPKGKDTKTDGLAIAYINQQNTPNVIPIDVRPGKEGGSFIFSARFPYTEKLMNGLTIAAVVGTQDPALLNNITAVGKQTLYGPGLIEIN